MKALSLLVRKLWQRLKFFESRSNFKVKVMRSTRVSVETGSSTGLFLFIPYKHFSHRWKSTEWLVMWTRVILHVCSLNFLKGYYLKTVTDAQNLTTRYRKSLNERIPNDILHLKFKRKISISQSNLLYPKYGVYVYKYLKRQKRPKKCWLRNGTESKNTS